VLLKYIHPLTTADIPAIVTAVANTNRREEPGQENEYPVAVMPVEFQHQDTIRAERTHLAAVLSQALMRKKWNMRISVSITVQ